MNLPSSVRLYGTAYRSVTLPAHTDFVWQAVAPPSSIQSWGCTIVDRCEIDERDPAVRTIHLVPAQPGLSVQLKEKLIKAEQTPAGEKGTVVYEHIDSGAASPYPARIIEMHTSLSVSRITTLTSPLGRTFVELRSTFVVATPEEAAAMTEFLEKTLFEPLLHSMVEMLVPVHPFRDAMFHSVMQHFEGSVEKLAAAAARVKTLDARKALATTNTTSNGDNHNANNTTTTSSSSAYALEDPISVSHFAATALSIAQELYSAWLETSRELRRVEKKVEEDEQQREADYERNKKPPHSMSARYDPTAATATTTTRPKMTDMIALNSNKVFGHDFNLSTPGTYIVSAPIAAKQQQLSNNTTLDKAHQEYLAALGTSPAQAQFKSPQSAGSSRRSVNFAGTASPPDGWEQEIFDDDADHAVAEDMGKICDGRGELMQAPPVPPPRRVLGGR